MYQDIINSDEGGPRHSIYTPRDYKQVINILWIKCHCTILNLRKGLYRVSMKEQTGLSYLQIDLSLCKHIALIFRYDEWRVF